MLDPNELLKVRVNVTAVLLCSTPPLRIRPTGSGQARAAVGLQRTLNNGRCSGVSVGTGKDGSAGAPLLNRVATADLAGERAGCAGHGYELQASP